MEAVPKRGLSRNGKFVIAVAVLLFTTVALGGSAYAMSLLQKPSTLGNYTLSITSECPFNPIAGDVGQTCNLTAIFRPSCPGGSLCPDFVEVVPTPQYNVQWTFGDGQNASGNPVSHHYPGNIRWSECFTATVVVTDAEGNSASGSIDALTGGSPNC